MIDVKKTNFGDVLKADAFTSSKHLVFTDDHFVRVGYTCTFVRFEIVGGRKTLSLVQFPDGRRMTWRTSALTATDSEPCKGEISDSTNNVVNSEPEVTPDERDNPYPICDCPIDDTDSEYASEIGTSLTQHDLDVISKLKDIHTESHLNLEIKQDVLKPRHKQLDLFEDHVEKEVKILIPLGDIKNLVGNPEETLNYINSKLGITKYPEYDKIINKGYFVNEKDQVDYFDTESSVKDDIAALAPTKEIAIATSAFTKLIIIQHAYNDRYVGDLNNRYCITHGKNYSGEGVFIIEECGLRHRSMWFYSKEDARHFLTNYHELLVKANVLI